MTKIKGGLEKEFLQAMPDYMKAHWGVNEEKIIFDFIRSWALGCVGEGWIAVPIEGNAYEAGLAMKGYNQAKLEVRKKIEEVSK